jgi:hypothetical protein
MLTKGSGEWCRIRVDINVMLRNCWSSCLRVFNNDYRLWKEFVWTKSIVGSCW